MKNEIKNRYCLILNELENTITEFEDLEKICKAHKNKEIELSDKQFKMIANNLEKVCIKMNYLKELTKNLKLNQYDI